MKITETIKQFAKFFLIGIMNTLVDLFVLNVETIITGVKDGWGYSIQKSFSFIVAVTFSYFFNKHWTFQDDSKEKEGKKFSQFMFVSIIGMIINVAVSTLAIKYLKAPVNELLNLSLLTDQVWVNLGAICGTAVGLFWNFVGYKLWVFKK
ncbi:MAG: GtrA family protein [Candidatus Moraniibacteriota bacterium]